MSALNMFPAAFIPRVVITWLLPIVSRVNGNDANDRGLPFLRNVATPALMKKKGVLVFEDLGEGACDSSLYFDVQGFNVSTLEDCQSACLRLKRSNSTSFQFTPCAAVQWRKEVFFRNNGGGPNVQNCVVFRWFDVLEELIPGSPEPKIELSKNASARNVHCYKISKVKATCTPRKLAGTRCASQGGSWIKLRRGAWEFNDEDIQDGMMLNRDESHCISACKNQVETTGSLCCFYNFQRGCYVKPGSNIVSRATVNSSDIALFCRSPAKVVFASGASMPPDLRKEVLRGLAIPVFFCILCPFALIWILGAPFRCWSLIFLLDNGDFCLTVATFTAYQWNPSVARSSFLQVLAVIITAWGFCLLCLGLIFFLRGPKVQRHNCLTGCCQRLVTGCQWLVIWNLDPTEPSPFESYLGCRCRRERTEEEMEEMRAGWKRFEARYLCPRLFVKREEMTEEEIEERRARWKQFEARYAWHDAIYDCSVIAYAGALQLFCGDSGFGKTFDDCNLLMSIFALMLKLPEIAAKNYEPAE